VAQQRTKKKKGTKIRNKKQKMEENPTRTLAVCNAISFFYLAKLPKAVFVLRWTRRKMKRDK